MHTVDSRKRFDILRIVFLGNATKDVNLSRLVYTVEVTTAGILLGEFQVLKNL